MATKLYTIERLTRDLLSEPNPGFWSSDEIIGYISSGIRDLWRPMVDLKQEYFLTFDNTNVTLSADTTTLSGVPSDVHKVYALEVRDGTNTSANIGLKFRPREFHDEAFVSARTLDSIDPSNDTIFYAVMGAGAPVSAPTIRVAPTVTGAVNLTLTYVPTVGTLTSSSTVPLPGETDNALVAWAVAYARSKEREDRAPDPGWMSIYNAERAQLLQSLGVRNLHKPVVANAMFEEYW